MKFGLTERVALITGASQGLGAAIAEGLASEGARIVICARRAEKLEECVEKIRTATGAEVTPIVADVTSVDDTRNLFAAILERYARLDALVVNVPHPQLGGFADLDEAAWRRDFDDVFMSTVRLLQLALPPMRKAGWGRIINISSSVVKEPASPYLISATFRAGIVAMLRSLAAEVGRDGIRINGVAPGLIRTPLGTSLLEGCAAAEGVTPDQVEHRYAALTATGRIGEPAEVANLVTFLCSEAADHITGQHITIDGGKSRALL